jgi:hypothetical protein
LQLLANDNHSLQIEMQNMIKEKEEILQYFQQFEEQFFSFEQENEKLKKENQGIQNIYNQFEAKNYFFKHNNVSLEQTIENLKKRKRRN